MDADPHDLAAPAIQSRDLIEGLGKGLRVIESFDDEHSRQTPSGVAARTGISRTAARRYLLSLVHFGYAASDGKQFWLTPRVLRVGQSYLSAARLPRLVQPFIQRISMNSGQTVNASVLDGHEVVYVARSNPPRLVTIGHHAGARVPAHVVAPGVVMLSNLADDALDAWLGQHEFSAYTGQTVKEAAQFREWVVAARQLGYWIADRQLEAGLCGLAVPLKNRRGECMGSIGMTLQRTSHTQEQLIGHLLPLLQEAAQDLRALL